MFAKEKDAETTPKRGKFATRQLKLPPMIAPVMKQRFNHSRGPPNSRGFPTLPVELSLEIISYYPTRVVPSGVSLLLPPNCMDRSKTLRALSQTCRALRNLFFPLLWECINAYDSTHIQDDPTGTLAIKKNAWYYEDIAHALLWQSRVVTQDPEIAGYVRVVNVAFTKHSIDKVLAAFARCLSALPNLHTIQIVQFGAKLGSHIEKAFEGLRFPSVRTAILPMTAHAILQFLPELRVMKCTDLAGTGTLHVLNKSCRNIEVLSGFRSDNRTVRRIVNIAPNLRHIGLRIGLDFNPATLQLLLPLKQLAIIELDFSGRANSDEYCKACIQAAKDILRTPQTGSIISRKYVRVKSNHEPMREIEAK